VEVPQLALASGPRCAAVHAALSAQRPFVPRTFQAIFSDRTGCRRGTDDQEREWSKVWLEDPHPPSR
jgi:hypothetical protein